MKHPRPRLTVPGDVITDAADLARELKASPSIYWHGRCFASAFVLSMQFWYVVHEAAKGNFRRSVRAGAIVLYDPREYRVRMMVDRAMAKVPLRVIYQEASA